MSFAASGLDKHELRRRSKIINYALLYGKTAFTLAKDIGVTPAKAQEFIDAYFGGYPRVQTFIDKTLEDARKNEYVETMFGRRRRMPELNSRNGTIRQGAERMAVNFPIQGTAADIMKRAMLRVHEALRGDKARMILTVHDELVIESPEETATNVGERVREAMQGATELVVPLTVDVGVGPNWREAKS
jgi:DNA polymerase-1